MGIDTFQPHPCKKCIWVANFLVLLLLVHPEISFGTNNGSLNRDSDPIILAQAGNTDSSAKSPDQSAPPPSEQPPKEGAAAEEEEEEDDEGPSRIPLAGVAQGGVLLQRDQLVLEPTLGYSFATNTRLIFTGFSVLPIIILGTLESEKATTQTFAPSLGFRYGIKRGIQFDLRVPFLVQSITRLRVLSEQAGQGEASGEDAGVGDVTFGISYQFLYERAWIPDMVFRLGASAPTGRSQFDIFEDIEATGQFESIDQFQQQLTSQGSALGSGRWTIDGTLTAVKALDPAVLFGTVGYSYSPSANKTLLALQSQPGDGGVTVRVAKVESNLGPVNSITASLGMAISLNNQLSMNWSFSNLYRFSQEANGVNIPDSQLQVANFNMGFNIAITPRVTANILGTIGITPDSPDFGASLTVPVSFTNAVGSTITWLKEHRPFRSKAPPPLPEEPPAQKVPTSGQSPSTTTTVEPPSNKQPTTNGNGQKNGNGHRNGNGGPPSTKEPQK